MVLLFTLVLLVVLATVGYTLSNEIRSQKHRNQYMIDYQIARYGCDSAVKYALATMQQIDIPAPISRPNEPDFSDLFRLNAQEYRQFVENWGVTRAEGRVDANNSKAKDVNNTKKDPNDVNNRSLTAETNDMNVFDANRLSRLLDGNEPNKLIIPGPYGSQWPLVIEPIDFEIGTSKVTIEIEDENAKYPIIWTLLEDQQLDKAASASLKTFCEWMGVDDNELGKLKDQLDEVRKIKLYRTVFQPVEQKTTQPATQPAAQPQKSGRSARTKPAAQTNPTMISPKQQATLQAAFFAKLLNSSMIDTETLAKPTIEDKDRKESVLKYLGMWSSTKVNINTAPRHVLEAAFTFGGDAAAIADETIKLRKVKPFTDLDKFRNTLFRYSDSIKRAEPYITTNSDCFTIRITATSGVAKTTAIIAVRRNGTQIEKIAVING